MGCVEIFTMHPVIRIMQFCRNNLYLKVGSVWAQEIPALLCTTSTTLPIIAIY